MTCAPIHKTEDASVYLTTVSDLSNADVVTSLLHSYNIPVVRKFRGAGDYLRIYMGSTCYGIDLYVPNSALEDAKDILAFKGESPGLQMPDEETELHTKYKKRQRVISWIILLFLPPGILLAPFSIIMSITSILEYFR